MFSKIKTYLLTHKKKLNPTLMSEDRVIKKLYMSKREGRRNVGTPKMRWLDDVEEDLRRLRISGWRGKARRRDEWKSVLREVKVLQGP
jgi:hypothetical protein